MSHITTISNQSERIIARLASYMEAEECTIAEGQELKKELLDTAEENPDLLKEISVGLTKFYASKIHDLCDQYQENTFGA
ncbi:hypothetical protein C2I27_03710 [Priestia megaterium]|uniref:hypothetical protein n=1 Tax=Priestia megaterium TaxID=1404 RepID=UPI000D525669|nr:hypothetical protein [Priestia megaterium]PVC75006.1 hypothetical protein C2I27_03710 [Priestia megaterium]